MPSATEGRAQLNDFSLFLQNFHDCTAHIRKKHEISHVQAGRYVDKLDTDVPLPPSATGHYKVRAKTKSLIGQNESFFPKFDETKKSPKNPNGTSDENVEHDRYAEFLIDPIRAFGEVIEPTETPENERQSTDEILIQADDDDEDDEVEA